MADNVVTVQASNNTISVNPTTKDITIEAGSNSITISRVGVQGPAGAAASTDQLTNSYTTGEAIGGQRVVVSKGGLVYHADSSDTSDSQNVIGVSRTAASISSSIDIIQAGTITDGSFSFTPDAALYFNTVGVITETVPSTGFTKSIGHAVTATRIFIDLTTPIIL